ncbi:zinc finger protein 354A-like [Toxorhynchites rutilus septentrionalis]|uniref:zinc finger protein 354A-like n=1 Tax=Toxorhynchites rutilus septentrionalis TaxID=329112 RepID=UPI002478C528|nr:zinc finger protein 354A-like [Toxorhynchites rutilus septentrionalis]
MSTLHAKIENICRLCLSGDDNLESIFGDSGNELLQVIIYDCTSVKVSAKLGYPTSICTPCKGKVENFYRFREQCIQNDEYLRSTFLEPEVVIKTEPDYVIATGYEEDDGDDDDDINEDDIEEWDESESNEALEEMQIDGRSVDGDITAQSDYLLGNGLDFSGNLTPTHMFKCEFCSTEFPILEQLEKHIINHKEEKIFKCFYCPKTFHFAKNLNMHVEYIHSKVKYSQKSISRSISFAQNLLVSNDKGTSLSNNTGSININNNNISGRSAKSLQSQSFASANRLGSTRISNHECHVCHKSFSDLRQHMLLHDGEKPYKCDICSKSFFNASTLKTHYRVHSDENPFRCTTCTKVFDNARSLELHYRTHTGERPYSCDVCLKKFSCSSNLKRHRKLHDRD